MQAKLHRLLYRAALKLSGDTLANLEFLRAQEWLPREQIQAVQRDRMKRLLAHASVQVPYYQRVLAEAGVTNTTGAIRLEHFSKVPLLDKSKLHMSYNDLKSQDLTERKWYENSSSGSTGQTAHFIQDREYADWGRALSILFDQWAGHSMGDPKFLVWSISRDLSQRQASTRSRLSAAVRNERWMDGRFMTPGQMRRFLAAVETQKPALVLGIPEEIYHLSRFALDEALRLSHPCAVATNGSRLFFSMRPTIEAAFGGGIFDRYGSRELSDVAAECDSHLGLHVCPPTHYVEILRSDGSRAAPGEIGEVVVTSLISYAMPLIRYRIGDLAAWHEEGCSCGRNWPLLHEIEGRTRDLFLKPDGSNVRIAESVFYHHRWVKEFQVIQEDYDTVRALVVPYQDEELSDQVYAEGIRKIEETISGAMGAGCRVDVEITDRIDRSTSGKYRHHISRIP